MAQLEFLITEDGSHTLWNTNLNEHYHSIHGAIQESRHVFIDAGFLKVSKQKSKINILEIGFGTGLNAYLTLLENKKLCKNISYTSLEAFPISVAEAEKLNYSQLLVNNSKDELFEQLHSSDWEKEILLCENFKFCKLHSSLHEIEFKKQFDLIYFDAFSPALQPEMWTAEIFQKMYSCMNEEGLLITYCAKGEVKRTLKKVGFKLVSLPGPPGKREITAAFKMFEV